MQVRISVTGKGKNQNHHLHGWWTFWALTYFVMTRTFCLEFFPHIHLLSLLRCYLSSSLSTSVRHTVLQRHSVCTVIGLDWCFCVLPTLVWRHVIDFTLQSALDSQWEADSWLCLLQMFFSRYRYVLDASMLDASEDECHLSFSAWIRNDGLNVIHSFGVDIHFRELVS